MLLSLSLAWLIPSVVHMAFHVAPIFSPDSKDIIFAILSSSCCLVEYTSHPISVASSWSDALGQKLKAWFSSECLIFSMKEAKGIDWARIMLHQTNPSSVLEEKGEKYCFKEEKESRAKTWNIEHWSGMEVLDLSRSKYGGIIDFHLGEQCQITFVFWTRCVCR